MSAVTVRLFVCVLCGVCALYVDARRSHRNGGDVFQSERFIFREQCALKQDSGPCKAIKNRFFFNIDSGRCESFEFGGCGGNDNNFISKEECEETCVVSEDKDPCSLPEAPGPCRGLVSRFLFDPQVQSCRHFFYGGCFGNANNFRTMDECRGRCQNPDKDEQTTIPPKTEAPEVITRAVRRMKQEEPTTANDLVRVQALVQSNQTSLTKSKESEWSDPCASPLDRGSCDGAHRRYFYDATSRRCQSFSFSGCGGNNNNFQHRRHCIRKCVLRVKDHRGVMGEKKIRIRRKNLDKFKQVSV